MDKVTIIGFLIQFVIVLGNLITYAIFGRVIVSWVSMGRPGQRGRIAQFLVDVTDPVINIFKKLPHRIGMLDLSPLIALVVVDLVARGIATLLTKLVV